MEQIFKKFFFSSRIFGPKRLQWECRTGLGWPQLLWQKAGTLGSSRAHALPFQRAFSLSSSYWYLAILRTGFCTLKAVTESFLLVSYLCIACMLLKATRRYSVKGEGYKFEDQGPLDGGDLSKRYPLMLSLIRFMNRLQKSLQRSQCGNCLQERMGPRVPMEWSRK